MIESHHDGRFNKRKKSVRAIAWNGREYGDKHLAAHLIPISLTLMQQYAGSQSAKAAKSVQGPDFGSNWSNTAIATRQFAFSGKTPTMAFRRAHRLYSPAGVAI